MLNGTGFCNSIADYDNDEVLKSIKCPTLFLFAEHGINVNPDENIDHFYKVFDGNPPDNFTIEVMKSGQHGFYVVKERCVDWATAEKQPFDPQFQELIRQWVIGLEDL